MFAYCRNYLQIVILIIGIAIFFGIALALLFQKEESMELMKADKQGPVKEKLQAQYQRLVKEMIKDMESDPRFLYHSFSPFSYHPNFRLIVALGRPIVPMVIDELRATDKVGWDALYLFDLLKALLPEEKLGQIYGNRNYRDDSKIHRQYWLRWWDDYGSKQDWSH